MIADGERRIELFRPPTQVNKASQTSQACEESSQTSETSQSSESSQASKFSLVNWRCMELITHNSITLLDLYTLFLYFTFHHSKVSIFRKT